MIPRIAGVILIDAALPLLFGALGVSLVRGGRDR
jgi:hypothetical protein